MTTAIPVLVLQLEEIQGKAAFREEQAAALVVRQKARQAEAQTAEVDLTTVEDLTTAADLTTVEDLTAAADLMAEEIPAAMAALTGVAGALVGDDKSASPVNNLFLSNHRGFCWNCQFRTVGNC